MAEGTRKNPLEYEREYNEFMYKLRRFLASKDMPLRKLPLFGGEEIDLYLLYKTVTSLGGWLKVTDERKWHEVAMSFNLPASCMNSAFALRQLYVRYLEGYEKLYFLGEDSDETAFPRLNLQSFGHSSYHPSPAYKDSQKNFERLVLALQSGLPNEVDFAINICMLLSNVNNSVFNLAKAPAVVDMMLAHVGVFLEDSYGSSDLYKEWYKASGKDFLKFWKRVLNCEEIKELLPKDDGDGPESSMQFCAEEIFNIDKAAAHDDYELQRVLQVCTILHNFSFDKMDALVLSTHPVCWRFLLFCLHSNIGSLKKLATDTMTNLADKTVLEPLESLNSQLFFFMVDRYVQDSDRYNRISAMNILKKVCLMEENQECICKALDITTYEALIKVLILHDVQLLVHSLETLYQLSGLGQIPCDHIVAVERSIEILVSILNTCVESFGAESLAQVKIVDNYRGMSVGGPKATHGKVLLNSTAEQGNRSEAESEAFAQHWLRTAYEVDPASTVLQRDLYADYLTSCGKISRSAILNSASFYKILRCVYPDVQIVKLNTGNQQLYGLVGMKRRLPSDHQLQGQSPMTHASHRQQLSRTPTPPMLHTPSHPVRAVSPPMGMETNYAKSTHAPRTPTPPMQRDVLRRSDGLVTNVPPGLPMGVQPSSLPGQRRDVIPNVKSSPHTAQPAMLPTQPPSAVVPSLPVNSTIPQTAEVRNNPTVNNPVPNTRHTLNGGTNNPELYNPGGQNTPSSTSSQHGQDSTKTPPPAQKPDSVAGAAGLPPCPTTSSKTRLGSEHSGAIPDPGQSRTLHSGIVDGGSAGTQSNGPATVNGGEEHSGVKPKGTTMPGSTVAVSGPVVPVVNGTGTNDDSAVLLVAKEENASKIARQEHEVVISIVENPTKAPVENNGQLESTADGLVTSPRRKRANPLLSDKPSEKSKTEPILNGPFSASEMLRHVAKRQRCNSEGEPLVNGVLGANEPKGPIAWDEVPKSYPKPGVASAKVPMTVNGVRLDLVTQHAQVAAPQVGTECPGTLVNDVHVKTNTVFPGYNMPANGTNSTQERSVNTGVSNPGTGIALPPTSVVATTASEPLATLNRNAVATTSSTPAVLPTRSGGTEDTSRGAEVRGEQAGGGTCGPYRCMWENCGCSFGNSKLLYNHAVSAHAPIDQLFTYCQWEGCSNVRRSRASLLFHLRQRHLGPSPVTLTKDPSLPKPQKAPATGVVVPVPPPNATAAPPVVSRPVYPPHPSVNPLLMSLKEQLLQTEQESPLTKSIRLTAALILRNIAKHSPTGRRKLKRFESSFTEIMCSKLESNAAIAACLHEMTRRRQKETGTSAKR